MGRDFLAPGILGEDLVSMPGGNEALAFQDTQMLVQFLAKRFIFWGIRVEHFKSSARTWHVLCLHYCSASSVTIDLLVQYSVTTREKQANVTTLGLAGFPPDAPSGLPLLFLATQPFFSRALWRFRTAHRFVTGVTCVTDTSSPVVFRAKCASCLCGQPGTHVL
jgi:hypothetical protein